MELNFAHLAICSNLAIASWIFCGCVGLLFLFPTNMFSMPIFSFLQIVVLGGACSTCCRLRQLVSFEYVLDESSLSAAVATCSIFLVLLRDDPILSRSLD